MSSGKKRAAFHDATWADYLTKPRIPEGAVHLIIWENLVRVLTRVSAHWQIGILSFSGWAMPQMLASGNAGGEEDTHAHYNDRHE